MTLQPYLDDLSLIQKRMDNVISRENGRADFKESHKSLIDHFQIFSDEIKLIGKQIALASEGACNK